MNRITYRDATPEDWPAIKVFHVEQQRLQKTNYELPWLWGENFPVVLVGVDRNGKLRNCFYTELVPELRFVGCDPIATAFSQREADGLCYVLKLMGFRCLDCFVPRALKKAIAKPLSRAKFRCKDKEFSLFARDLR